MKQISFISTSGEHGNDLSFCYQTLNGYVYAVHIYYFSEQTDHLFKAIESELISYISGDKPMIEVTPRGKEILEKEFIIRNNSCPLYLVNVKRDRMSRYEFADQKTIDSGLLNIIN